MIQLQIFASLGKGETSSKPPLFGFKMLVFGGVLYFASGVGDVCQRIWSYQNLGSEHYKRFTTVPRLNLHGFGAVVIWPGSMMDEL